MEIKNERISEIYRGAKNLEKQEFHGKIAIHCTEALAIVDRLRFAEAKLAAMESQEAPADKPDHWAVMSPGRADQYRAESVAVRKELGFSEDSDEVAPIDLLNAIRQMRADRSRFTEQDAREIAMDAVIHYSQKHGMDYAEWMRSGGRTLLNKLNADREQATAVAVPDEEVAKMFHESYEKLAPSFGYETREETRKDWEGVPPNNKALMIAVIKQIRLALLTSSHSQQSAHVDPGIWHRLKTDPGVFDDVAAGRKTHEIRLNDRGFEVGHGLHLLKTVHSGEEMQAGAPLEYTGDEFNCVVTHVLSGYGLKDGWVILSIAPLPDRCPSQQSEGE